MASINHILMASDLTQQARPALLRALQLKQELAAQLTLLHVIEPGLPAAITERRRQEALAVLQQEINAAAGGELRRLSIEVLVGERFGAIVEQAETKGADLIVLGDGTKRRWKDLFVGTTTERVVRLSNRPVLVVTRPGDGAYRRVLTAFDLSPGASVALRTALAVAAQADFRIVHAWQTTVLADFAGKSAAERAAAEEERHVRELLDGEISRIEGRSAAQSEIKIVEGSAYFVMRGELKAYQPDLLAMGTHARSSIGTALVGSLTRDLLTEAPCDVLVARP